MRESCTEPQSESPSFLLADESIQLKFSWKE